MSFIEDSIRLTPHEGQKPEWEKQVVEKFEYFKEKLRTLAAYVFPKPLKAARTVRFAQKWHHSGGLEWINPWRRHDRHFVSLCLECLHQATNVHGLGTAAHGAMVIDELQSSGLGRCTKTQRRLWRADVEMLSYAGTADECTALLMPMEAAQFSMRSATLDFEKRNRCRDSCNHRAYVPGENIARSSRWPAGPSLAVLAAGQSSRTTLPPCPEDRTRARE